MRRNLRGKRLLVTGASSGIGACLASQAVEAGARVVLTAQIRADRLEEAVRTLTGAGFDARAIPADITSDDDRRRMLQSVVDQLGGLDVVINNAGVSSQGHFCESSEDLLRGVMEVNFFAPAELTRLAIPVLAEGRQPAVVNVSSMCGRRGWPAWSDYSASKFALCGLTEAIRAELVRFGIDVLLIVPGLTRTGLEQNLLHTNARMQVDFTKGMWPEDVARKILRSLRTNRTETVLGSEARWALLAHRYFPWLLEWGLQRFVKRQYAETPVK